MDMSSAGESQKELEDGENGQMRGKVFLDAASRQERVLTFFVCLFCLRTRYIPGAGPYVVMLHQSLSSKFKLRLS